MRALILVFSFLVFYLLLNLSIPPTLKFFLIILELGITGEWLRREYKLDGEYGLVLLKSKKGLLLIDRLAKKYKHLLEIFADVSIALAFGLSSLFVLKWLKWKKRIALVGFALLLSLFLSLYLSPYVLPTLIMNINISPSPLSPEVDLSVIFFFLFGFMGYISFSLLQHALLILIQLYHFFLFGGGEKIVAGATLLLPGINLPLLEGVLALALILVVHEGSHALLTRVARVRLLSSGVVLFGFLPVGAFVEPDEEELSKKSVEKQERVLAAGTGGNFFASIFLFFLLGIFLVLTAPFAEKGCLVVGGKLPKGTLIKAINGHPGCDVKLSPNTTVIISTIDRNITLTTDEEGRIGIVYYNVGKGYIRYYSFPPFQFLYNLLALAFALNFVIATVNLLPIPFFDGYRMLELVVGERIAKPLSYLLLIALLVNFLPAVL